MKEVNWLFWLMILFYKTFYLAYLVEQNMGKILYKKKKKIRFSDNSLALLLCIESEKVALKLFYLFSGFELGEKISNGSEIAC